MGSRAEKPSEEDSEPISSKKRPSRSKSAGELNLMQESEEDAVPELPAVPPALPALEGANEKKIKLWEGFVELLEIDQDAVMQAFVCATTGAASLQQRVKE